MWANVYETDKLYLAQIVKDVLHDGGVEAVVFNQQDSSYLVFGSIRVMVAEEDEAKAREILKMRHCE